MPVRKIRVQGKSPMPRDLVKENTWRRIFQKCDASGQSGRQFCKSEGLSEHQFYAWRTIIRNRDSEGKPQDKQGEGRNPFVRIRLAGEDISPLREAPVEVVLPGGAFIRVTGESNIGLVCRILTTMEKSKC
jgi:hypothetical protein